MRPCNILKSLVKCIVLGVWGLVPCGQLFQRLGTRQVCRGFLRLPQLLLRGGGSVLVGRIGEGVGDGFEKVGVRVGSVVAVCIVWRAGALTGGNVGFGLCCGQ